MQIEQQVKRKTVSMSQTRTQGTLSWSPSALPANPAPRVQDKTKPIRSNPTVRPSLPNPPPGHRQDARRESNATQARYIICFKCQGHGHYARNCPNQRVMIIIPEREYKSQEEEEEDVLAEEVEYPDVGELLVIRRMLSVTQSPHDTNQRENIFHTRCTVSGLIIDGCSCTNVATVHMVKKRDLPTTKHPKAFKT